MVPNIGRITMPYGRIPSALEQGNVGSHQGIELGNRYCLARSFHWRYLAFVLNENELWLVMKALGCQSDTGKWGRSLMLPISR